MKSPMSNSRGFTLIELMIVIAIIAVLSTIGLMSYKVILQNSRDGKRQSDLRLIQSYLEQYHADQFGYPPAYTCVSGVCSLTFGTKTYLSLIPSEPLSSPYPQYIYKALNTSGASPVECVTGSKCSTYCIYAALENNSQGISPGLCANNNPDVSKYNFAVSPP